MIEVEFRRPAAGGGYEAAATLRVEDDGTHTQTGDESLVLTDVTILDKTRPGGRLRFEDDPAEWARNARKAFRTGYLVPVVISDTAAPTSSSSGKVAPAV